MCLPGKQETTRMLFELRHDDGNLKVIDPDRGRLLFDSRHGTLPHWVGDTPPTHGQRRLLQLIGAIAAPPTPTDAPAVDTDEHSGPMNRRRKLWELNHRYHCPVIGTCASVTELRKVARQARLQSEARLSDYEVHSSFVVLAEERCPATRQLHKLLERKYAHAIKHFSRADDEQALRGLWTEARGGGGVAGALWAVMTHPKTSATLAHEVYQDIHMLSHQVGAANRADLQRLEELVQENRRLKRELQRNALKSAQTLAGKNKHIQTLTKDLASAREAEIRLQSMESGAEVRRLGERIAELEQNLAAACIRAERAERRAQQHQVRTKRIEEIAVVASLAETPPSADCTDCPGAEACPQLDLNGCCVLCVGGRTGTADCYRRLVEESNGRFLHHDGGLEENVQRLSSLLQRADAVVCPADCVSHDAALRVKRYCKRHGKTCIFLRSSGSSAFAGALGKLVRDTNSCD